MLPRETVAGSRTGVFVGIMNADFGRRHAQDLSQIEDLLSMLERRVSLLGVLRSAAGRAESLDARLSDAGLSALRFGSGAIVWQRPHLGVTSTGPVPGPSSTTGPGIRGST